MDWKKLCDDVAQWAEAHRDEFVKDISDVCRIRSTSHNQLDCTNAPFGQACRDMLDKALEMSSAYGFETATMTTSAAAPSTGIIRTMILSAL